MDEAELENLNVSLVREWCKSEHVESLDAMTAFNNGRGVFDVSPQARKLDEFIREHGLQNQVRRSSLAALLNNGTVHFAFKSKPN